MSKPKIICTEEQKKKFLEGLHYESSLCPANIIKKSKSDQNISCPKDQPTCEECFEREFNFIIKNSDEHILDAIKTINKHCKKTNCSDCILAKSSGLFRGSCILTELDLYPSCWDKELLTNKGE